jgi:hypothetical protein
MFFFATSFFTKSIVKIINIIIVTVTILKVIIIVINYSKSYKKKLIITINKKKHKYITHLKKKNHCIKQGIIKSTTKFIQT